MATLKTGITNTSYGVYAFEDAIKRISDQGYDCIDYQGFVNIETDFFKLPWEEFEAELMRHKALFTSHGLSVSQVHAPWRTPKDGDPEERKRWIEAMKKSIRGAYVLGSTNFVVHPLMPYMESGKCQDEVWQMNEQFLTDLADYAKGYGVTVCLENMPFTEFPISTVEDDLEMLGRIGRDNLRICLDTGHAAIFKGKDVASAVRMIGDKLKAVHIHDNMGKEDEHLIPGDGIIDWNAFADALREIGYTGVISLETSPKHKNHPKEKWEERELALKKIVDGIAEKASRK